MTLKKAAQPTRVRVAVDEELTRARGRIRTVEALTSLLVIAAAVLAFTLVMISLDLWRGGLPEWVRQLSLACFLLAALVYVVLALVRPLRRDVNPYFAARALEKTLPGSKNAIVNYLDLKERPLPGVIRDAVNRQAAREVMAADVEEAIPARRPLRAFLCAAAFLVGLFVFSLMAPEQFGSLLGRAFFPFGSAPIPSDTRFLILSPTVQDHPSPRGAIRKMAVVEPGQFVEFKVRIEGVVPESAFLDIFNDPVAAAPNETRKLMRPKDSAGTLPWTLIVEKERVPPTGFWFRIRGGDGKTELVQLVVATQRPPRVQHVEAVYEYPPYTARESKRQLSAPLHAIEGTRVRLDIQADQPVESGEVRVASASGKEVPYPLTFAPTSEGVSPDRTRLVLREQAGDPPLVLGKPMPAKTTYSIYLRNQNGEKRSGPYDLEFVEDAAPQVELRRVGRNPDLTPDQKTVQLPANDVAPVLGRARDDVAVDHVRLKVRRAGADEEELRILGGRSEQGPLQRANGYMQEAAEFFLLLDLNKLADPRDGSGKPLTFRPGDLLELWVEATDTRTPNPQAGRSRTIRIELIEPLPPEQQQDRENQARQEQKHHDQKHQQDGNPPPNKPDPNPQDQQGNADNPAQARDAGRQNGQPQDRPDQNARGQGKPQDGMHPDKPEQNARGEGQQNGQPEKNPHQNARGQGGQPQQAQSHSQQPQPDPENQNARDQGNAQDSMPDSQPDAQARKEGNPRQGQPETNAQAGARDQGRADMDQPQSQPKADARDQGRQGPMNEDPNAQARGQGQDPRQAHKPDKPDKPAADPNHNARAGDEQTKAENATARGEGEKPPMTPQQRPDAQARNQGQQGPMNERPDAVGKDQGKPEEGKPEAQARGQGQDPRQAHKPDKPAADPNHNARAGDEQTRAENATARGEGEKPPMTPQQRPDAQARNQGQQGPMNERPDAVGKDQGKPEEGKPEAQARGQGQDPRQAHKPDKPDKPAADPNHNARAGDEQTKAENATARGEGEKPPMTPQQRPDAQARNQGQQGPMNERPDAVGKDQGKPEEGKPEAQARGQGQDPRQAHKPDKSEQGPSDRPAQARGSRAEENRQGNQQADQFGQEIARSNHGFPEKPDKPTEEFLKKATDLQLKTIQEELEQGRIDRHLKELLNKLDLTPQQALELLKQRPERVRASALAGNLQSHGPHLSQTSGRTPQEMNAHTRQNVPPELREAFENFTRKLNP